VNPDRSHVKQQLSQGKHLPEVTTYYLQMTSPDELAEKTESHGLVVTEAEINEYRFNRYLYQLVGEQWQWTDKLSLPEEVWKAYVESPNLRTWVGYYQGSIAGYYELESKADGEVELAYFGLAPDFIGKGFGGYFLSQAIKSAWSISGAQRVTVHTCTLDHPRALKNYQARGFVVYKEETESV
jgi:GNAT superfamily N-acetyltransferase